MFLKNRSANLTFILLLLSIFLFSRCDNVQQSSQQKKQQEPKEQLNDSAQIDYFSNGNIASYVTLNDTIKHGITKFYYPNGNLKYEVLFQNNKEEGTARYYYQTGKIYMETPYKNGIIHGLRKKYYKNGALMAEIPYVDDYLTYGIVEYDQSGEQIKNYPSILIKTKDNTAFNNSYTIILSLSKPQNEMQFYIDRSLFLETHTQAFEGNNLNIKKRDHQLLETGFMPVETEDGKASITINLEKGKYIMKDVIIVCSFATARNNVYWSFERYNLSIENRY